MTAVLSAPSATDALPVVEAQPIAILGDAHSVKFRFDPSTTSPDSIQRFVRTLEQSNLVLSAHTGVGSVTAHLNPIWTREQLIRHLGKRHADVVHLQTRSR